MDKLSSNIIDAYNKTREKNAQGLLCHAPSVSINFEQNGNMTACCYNRKHVLGTYPQTSIIEAWNGAKANELREYIKDNDLSAGCSACADILKSGNFNGSKAKYYDEYARVDTENRQKMWSFLKKVKPKIKPRVFEFEIANTCNLECIMCSGYFSSSIRKNRENLPPLYNPYDDTFVDQVAEFLPGITDLKYLGGEPFQIEIYLKIWERVARINPNIRNHITTNGTILNARVKNLIENMKSGIVLSIDSVKKETYEKIRKGASFDKVMENLDYFSAYAARKKTYVSMTVCPITTNAEEMPEMVRFANKKNMRIHFNTVSTPDYLSLRFADLKRLKALIELYSASASESNELERSNYLKLKEYGNQLKYWHDEQATEDIQVVDTNELFHLSLEPDSLTRKILEQIGHHYAHQTFDTQYHQSLLDLLSNSEQEVFIISYFEALAILERDQRGDLREFRSKIEVVKRSVRNLSQKELMATELIRTGVLYQLNYFRSESTEQILGSILSRYS